MENKVFMKAAWRLIPFMGILYVACFLDRVNLSFAALTMNQSIGLDPKAYGLAGGMFFLGYFFFEVPSNVILAHVGARSWIFRIMITWGLVSMATAFATGPKSVFALRFLLGVAEAGFFPGMVFYLTKWFPASMRGRFMALFLAAIALANIIGGPVSGALLGWDGVGGLHGWQWVFLIEGLPAVLLSFCVLLWLPDGPESARWLSPEERQTIATRLAADPKSDHSDLLPMLKDVRVWLLAIPDFGIVMGLYGIGLWLPQIVHRLNFTNLETGFVVALPYVVSAFAMFAWAASSDRSGERIWHVSAAAILAAASLFVAGLLGPNIWGVVALSLAIVGIYCAITVFWTLPPSFLSGTAAAGGIALVNAIANLGGFFGPSVIGFLKEATGNDTAGFFTLGGGLVMTAGTVLLLGRAVMVRAAPTKA